MRYDRAAVIDRAIAVLDEFGLADLTMRRLGTELGVQPSALYHHVANKQALLAAVADELLQRGFADFCDRPDAPWSERVADVCRAFRAALLVCSDGGDVAASTYAFGLGATLPADRIREILAATDLSQRHVRAGTATLAHYVFGHVIDEQTHGRAAQLGAELGATRERAEFDAGIGLIIDGLAAQLTH